MSVPCYLAPAKINLCLHVLSRRRDGYHELCMLMQKISLYDEVRIGLRDDGAVLVTCDGVDLGAGEENIAARAARAMQAYDVEKRGVSIDICKRIPVAAGLGGGSSDAATVLSVLNDVWNLQLDETVLADEALKLGADVPFFLGTSPAWAQGVGERLSPVCWDVPKCFYLLVNPNIPVSTAMVYASLSKYSVCEAIDSKLEGVNGLLGLLHNDLEPVAEAMLPQVGCIKQELLRCGAMGVLMSGSGPTVFAIFTDRGLADAAAENLNTRFGWWTYVAEGV